MDMSNSSIYSKLSCSEMEDLVQDVVSKALLLRKNYGDAEVVLFNNSIKNLSQVYLYNGKSTEKDIVKAKVLSEIVYSLEVLKKVGYEIPEKEFNRMWEDVKPGALIKEDYLRNEKHIIDETEKTRIAMRMKLYREICDIKGYSYIPEFSYPYRNSVYVLKENETVEERERINQVPFISDYVVDFSRKRK